MSIAQTNSCFDTFCHAHDIPPTYFFVSLFFARTLYVLMYHPINIQLNFVRVMKIDSFAPVSLRETTPTIPSLRCSQMQIKKCCSGLCRCNKN